MQTTLVINGEDRIWTILYPNEGKDTVLLLHGGPGYPDDLLPVVNCLWAHFQVITFHQRGTRKSPCISRDYTMDKYIADIDAVMAHFHIQKFHLFGHSWGGLYAQLYAQQYPASLLSLFLCNPALGTGPDWSRTEKEVLQYHRAACTRKEWLVMGYNSVLGMLGSDRAYHCIPPDNRCTFRYILPIG